MQYNIYFFFCLDTKEKLKLLSFPKKVFIKKKLSSLYSNKKFFSTSKELTRQTFKQSTNNYTN